MKISQTRWAGLFALAVVMTAASAPAVGQQRPNIIVIMGDDIGWFNIGAYHQGITGELPIRTGLTTVGQAGSPIGMPAAAPTIAAVLKSMGYATGQFGKNHLGDLNRFLPTVHGFDEYFGYLYHLDAMEDPCHRNYPPALKATVGPRNMI